MKQHTNNENGSTIIIIIALTIILNIALAAVLFSSRHLTNKTGIKRVKTSVINIAEAGKERLYAQVSWGHYIPKADTQETVYSKTPFQNGSYTVACRTNTTHDSLWVRSRATEGTITTTIETIASLVPDITIMFPPVRGAVTSRSRITVKGNIEIDGRDYDTSNTQIGSGTFGVSTCDSIFLSGSATIGGNDQIPVNDKNLEPVRSVVVDEMASVDPVFASPEAFLGLPAGALDAYKVSTLTTPFRGLVYLTNNYVGPVHFGESYGILIIHNPLKSAELQITDGTFRGLIIVDRMAKISGNATILGAVVTLSESEVSTFGTGTAVIHYSKKVLENLQFYCSNLRKKVQETAWKEVAN
jgi:hypothetical protein